MKFRPWMENQIQIHEMALDLSGIHDAFEDPEFKKALSNKKILLYHGTSTTNFWNIVTQGFEFNPNRMAWTNTTPGVYFTFSQSRAELYTHRAVKTFGGDPLIFVLEVPMKMLERDFDDSGLPGSLSSWDMDQKVQTMVKGSVKASHITGVIYPAIDNFIETPIRKFIGQVNKGKISSIEPNPNAELTGRFQGATTDDREHEIIQYLQDLMQYSGFENYLFDPSENLKFKQQIMYLLQKPEHQWNKIYNWNGDKWIEFLDKNFTREKEEDYYKGQREFQIPISSIINKYKDVDSYKKFRLGKK